MSRGLSGIFESRPNRNLSQLSTREYSLVQLSHACVLAVHSVVSCTISLGSAIMI